MTIFEDYPEDLLSRLFRAAYKDTGNNKFMYSQGNGALVFKVKEAIQEGAKDINVFIDAIPGNKSITKVYYNLKKVALENVGRVWVFPIVCAEYYFIQAFHDLCYLNSDTEIKCVLSELPTT